MGRGFDFLRGIKPVLLSSFFAGIFFGLVELVVILSAWPVKQGQTTGAFLYDLALSQYFLLCFYALLFALIGFLPAIPFGIWALCRGREVARHRLFIILSALPSAGLFVAASLIFLATRCNLRGFLRGWKLWLSVIIMTMIWVAASFLLANIFSPERGRRNFSNLVAIAVFLISWVVSIGLIYMWNENIDMPFPDDKASLAKDRPNIILLTIDTLRPDHLGCYGNAAVSSPNIDRLASTGYLFSQAVTAVPLTLPSHSSILTGVYPPRHGVRLNSQPLPESNTTLAEILADHGYQTAACISVKILGTAYGMGQGFYYFNSIMGGRVNFFYLQRRSSLFDAVVRALLDPPNILTRTAKKTTDEVMNWLRRNKQQPFFLWIHYYDPHLPLDPPEPFAEMYRKSRQGGERIYQVLTDINKVGPLKVDLRLYDGEVGYVDQQLGRIFSVLEEQQMMNDAIIIFTADHGEHLIEHNYYGHGLRLYDPSLRIPLIIKPAKAITRQERIQDQVQSVDIFPTILEMVSIPAPPDLNGRSLAGLMRNSDTAHHELSYGETRHSGKAEDFCYSLRTVKWKFILWPESQKMELYDLEADPGELTNLAEEKPRISENFKSRLESILTSQKEASGAFEVDLDEETRDMLHALGYMP